MPPKENVPLPAKNELPADALPACGVACYNRLFLIQQTLDDLRKGSIQSSPGSNSGNLTTSRKGFANHPTHCGQKPRRVVIIDSDSDDDHDADHGYLGATAPFEIQDDAGSGSVCQAKVECDSDGDDLEDIYLDLEDEELFELVKSFDIMDILSTR